jgi:hypothetical protein
VAVLVGLEVIAQPVVCGGGPDFDGGGRFLTLFFNASVSRLLCFRYCFDFYCCWL